MKHRPTALYYRMLKYPPENLDKLHREFDCIELDTPAQDTHCWHKVAHLQKSALHG